jgi:hypothetical protein
MTVLVRFGRIPALPRRFLTVAGTGQQPVTMTTVRLAGVSCGQAGGELRETTQPRNNDPTVQPPR